MEYNLMSESLTEYNIIFLLGDTKDKRLKATLTLFYE